MITLAQLSKMHEFFGVLVKDGGGSSRRSEGTHKPRNVKPRRPFSGPGIQSASIFQKFTAAQVGNEVWSVGKAPGATVARI